ncbi:hypothetical protein D3C71_1359140 [compost metagenome]
MIARHAPLTIALALLVAAACVPSVQAAAPDVLWTPLDPQSMPGVFYDSASIARVSEKPMVMTVTVAWFYAQHRVSETTGQSYGSVAQPITLNCTADTYTVTETRHYAGNNATGALVESIPVAGIHNAPVARDPVQRKLRAVVCPAPGKNARK